VQEEEHAMRVTAVLTPAEEGGYVAFNPETGTTTQGETIDEAIANLREAVELYLEEFPIAFSGAPLVTSFDIESRAA
jgi:predicted RNase H-like HicB family nuclease